MVGKSLVPPSILIEHAGLLERFLSLSHRITYTMLSRLSDALNLVGDHRFENSHREGEPTDTALKLIYEPTQACLADVVENKHTDFGTLTLLFGEQWGLHVELPETNTWGFVEPRAGYAVVNVADSLEHLSGKKLHSGVHRITQLVDVLQERYYIVYLLRPESGIKLRDAKEN
jgi:isopenicillin N synthase-like dioxygenase